MNFARAITAVMTLACLGAAHAATPDPSPAVLQEITVTAEKVKENLRDVPISMSVLGDAAIANEHIEDIADVTRAAPNFSFSSNGNPGGSILEMRGISSAAGASPVAIYLDDVSLTERLSGASLGQPEPIPLDIQQIEVLRGPQGTLYGASAEAGVVTFRSHLVDLSAFEGSGLAEGSYTEHGVDNYRVYGIFNAPIVDGSLGVRVAVQSDRNSGFIDRYSPFTDERVDTNINSSDDTAARVTIEARPSQSLSIIGQVTYQKTTYGSSNTVTLGLGDLSNSDQVPDGGADKLIVPSLTVKYDAGWAELTSITSDFTRNAPSEFDGTVFNSVYIGDCILDGQCGSPPIPDLSGNLSGAKIDALSSPGFDTSFSRVIGQEVRLNSRPYQPGGSPFTWVAGFYYQQSEDHHGDFEYIPQFNPVFTPLYGVGLLDGIFGGPLPNGLVYYNTYRFSEKQYSSFGNVAYNVSRRLKASVGIRYLSARFNVIQNAGGFFAAGASGFTADSADHAVTPAASIQYDVAPKDMIYATASKGFRLGGPNAPLPSFCGADLAQFGFSGAPTAYDHDSLWNYELGAKLRPSGTLAIDGATFYDKWSALQQQFYLPDCGSSFTTNVGAARSYGAELTVTARPTQGVTLSLAGGYTNAVLTTSVPAAGLAAGTRIEGVPDWSGNASIQYERPLSGTTSAAVRADYSYVGESHGTLIATNPDYHRPAYGLAGASVSFRVKNWELSLFARNLFNDQKIVQRPDHASVPVGLVLTPRTVGLSVEGEF